MFPQAQAHCCQQSTVRHLNAVTRTLPATAGGPCAHRPSRLHAVQADQLLSCRHGASRSNADLMSLVPWAIRNGLKFAKIKPQMLPGSGRGLICLSDIQPGESICEVPITAAVRVYPGCPPVLQIPQQVWQQLPWYVQLALTLLSEQQQGSASKWADYIRQLPAAVDVPVLWEETEIAALKCTYFVRQVQQQREDWAALQQQVAPYLSAARISTEQLYWALSITRSRTFAAPYSSNPFGAQLGWLNRQAGQQQQQQHVMCPLLDLFNHRGDVQSECEFYSDFRSASFRVVASQPWARGQEVFINYGGGSNDALLQLYGFVEPGNKEDRYIVRCLPAVLADQDISLSPDADAALQEVVLTRQGLDAAAVSQLNQLLSVAGHSQAAGSVPYAALDSSVKAVCATAVQQELSTLAVDAAADQEILQAFAELPQQKAEVENKQADLAKAQSRLQQLQEMYQESRHASTADQTDHGQEQSQQDQPQDSQAAGGVSAESDSAPAEATAHAELMSMVDLCEQLCEKLAAELADLQVVVARWQELVLQHKQLAVLYRSEKHKLLMSILQELHLHE